MEEEKIGQKREEIKMERKKGRGEVKRALK